MRLTISDRLRHSLDFGLILALLLSLFNIVPLASNPGLPNGADTLLHSYRAAEMLRSWEHGLITPRWAESFYFGYGSPLFHFYASLAYYLTSTLQLLFGMSALDALRWLLLLSLLTCSGGMYLFCKRRSGRLGALIAGLLYGYSPYLMYTEAYARGAYPELLAFALFPLLLWRIDALRDKATPLNFVFVFAAQVVLVNSHNLMAVALTAICLAWVIFETVLQFINREASQMKASSGLLALLALGLGTFAASSFWVPVLLESDSVQLENLLVPGVQDYRVHFVSLSELLSPVPIQDAGAINGLRQLRQLGVAQWGLALLGLASALLLYIRGYRTRHPQAFLGAAFFSLLSLALIFLTTPASLGVWQSLRPLQSLQYPWRLLGPLAACLAIVGSMNGIWLERIGRRYRIGAVALVVALPIVTIFPLLFVPEWRHTDPDSSIGAYLEEASAARQPGAAFADELLSRELRPTPARNVASVAAAVSVVGLILALAFLRNRQQTTRPYWTVPSLSRTSLIGILLGGGIALLAFAVTFREGIAWLNSPPGEALPAQIQRKYRLDDNLQLLGYGISSEQLRPGETLTVNLYWYALAETKVDFSSFLRLSAGGKPIAQIDKLHPGDLPTVQWSSDGYVLDRYELRLPTDLAAGEYDLIIGLYTCDLMPPGDCGNGFRPAVVDEDGNLIGDSITLGAIRVEDG